MYWLKETTTTTILFINTNFVLQQTLIHHPLKYLPFAHCSLTQVVHPTLQVINVCVIEGVLAEHDTAAGGSGGEPPNGHDQRHVEPLVLTALQALHDCPVTAVLGVAHHSNIGTAVWQQAWKREKNQTVKYSFIGW